MTFTQEKVMERLSQISLGGTTCVYSPEKCAEYVPKLNAILALKKEKKAVLLAHSYVSPEVLLVADFVGDSYELSKKAQSTNAEVIVFSAVKFMAETAKLLNPSKTVLVPSKVNGCSLADSITGEQVALLRQQYPDYTFVCYINTTAEVKAQCDVCVTSSNVTRIIGALPNPNIYFLPDRLMAQNVFNELKQKGIHKNLKWWSGTCYVHETFDPELIQFLRTKHQGLQVVSHPECDPSILAESDFVGSTSQMIQYVEKTHAPAYFLLTECGLIGRLQLETKDKIFVGGCTVCKYMKSNTLDDVIRVLTQPDPDDVVTLGPTVVEKATQCLNAMFEWADRVSKS